jgi:Polyketide cyclase / dehydrase and lipid transport.
VGYSIRSQIVTGAFSADSQILVGTNLGKDANNLVGQVRTLGVSIQIGRDSEGRHLEVARTIEADAAAVWEAFVDVREWPEWGPSVTAVECQHRYIQDGSTGRVCVFGICFPFEIDSFSESEPRRWSWQIRGFSATGHRVEQFKGSRSRAVFEIPLYAVWYTPVCQIALSRIERIATT